MTPVFATAENELTYPGDDPGLLGGYVAQVNDAREQVCRLQDGLLDAGAQLTACWTSAGQAAADREVSAQVSAAATILARIDQALTLVDGYRTAVIAARVDIDALRSLWSANLGAYDAAVAASDPVDIEGCRDRFEDIGADWRTTYERLKAQAAEVEGKLLQLTCGWSGPSDSLMVAVGVDVLVMDDATHAYQLPSLTDLQTEYLSDPGPAAATPVLPSAAFPLAEYQAAVARASLDDPGGFGKLAGAEFAACTDFGCVFAAADRYRLTTTTLTMAGNAAAKFNAAVEPILNVIKAVTVGDCLAGNVADCAMMFPVFKAGKVAGWIGREADAILSAEELAYKTAVDSNSLSHLFKTKHNFDNLVEIFGSQQAVFAEILAAIQGRTPASGRYLLVV